MARISVSPYLSYRPDNPQKIAVLHQIKDPLHPFNVISDYNVMHWPKMANRYTNNDTAFQPLSYVEAENNTVAQQALKLDGACNYTMLCKDIGTAVTGSVGYTIDMVLSCSNQTENHNIGPGTGKGYKTTIFHLKANVTIDTIGDAELYFQYDATNKITYLCYAVYNSSTIVRKWNVGTSIDSTGTGAKTHIAVVVDSNNGPRLFINGKLQTVASAGVNAGGIWHCNAGNYSCLVIGGHYSYTASSYEDRISCLFAGCIQNFRIRGGLIWTANFTVPTVVFTDTDTPNAYDYVLVPFNGSLKELVSGRYMTGPLSVNSTTTYCATGGKYSTRIEQMTRQGYFINANGGLYDDNFTVEMILYEFPNSAEHFHTDNQYLFYIGPAGTETTGGEISIRRKASGTSAYDWFVFTCGNKSKEVKITNKAYVRSFKMCLAEGQRLYLYVDNTDEGFIDQVQLLHGNAHCYVGFRPGLWNSGMDAYLCEFKFITGVAKYQLKSAPLTSNFRYESHLWMRMQNDALYAVDLDPGYSANLLTATGCNTGIKIKVPLTNGSLHDYWIPTEQIPVTNLGTCDTAGATALKMVPSVSGVSALKAGQKITVKFVNANTAANANFAIANLEHKPIYINNVAVTASDITAGQTYKFVYDLTNARWNGTVCNFGQCTTAKATAAKTVTIAGITKLTKNMTILVQFTADDTAENATLNVNDLGAKPVYYQGAPITAAAFAAKTYEMTYDGTNWNILGSRYFTVCDTAAATQMKIVNFGSVVSLADERLIFVKFTNANTKAKATLAIGSNGKPIYYGLNAVAKTAIKEGATVEMEYDGLQWNIISLDDLRVTDKNNKLCRVMPCIVVK